MNFIERSLYDFYFNVNRIRSLSFIMHNLLSVRAQGYDVHIYNSLNDPVTNVLILKERIHNRIKHISKFVTPVKKLDASLMTSEIRHNIMRSILHKKYWQHKDTHDILFELGISKSTLKRRNRELLNRAKEFFHDFQHS